MNVDPGDFTPEALAKIAPACHECGGPSEIAPAEVIRREDAAPTPVGKKARICSGGVRRPACKSFQSFDHIFPASLTLITHRVSDPADLQALLVAPVRR